MITEHPVLSAVPLDEDKPEPYFARLPQIDLRDVVKYVTRKEEITYDDNGSDDASSDAELDGILEEQHNTNFYRDDDKVAPFWRLIIVVNDGQENNTAQFVACFIYHHAIGDGASGKAFHRSFLSALQSRPPESEQPNPIIQSPDTPLLPNLELLHPLPLSVFYLLKALWHDLFLRIPKGLWSAHPITDAPDKRRTRYTSFTLSRTSTQSLLAASRANSTTLTATVQAAFVAALFANLPASEASVLHCNGAISLRRWLPSDVIDDDSIGTFVSEYALDHSRPGAGSSACELFSWAEARLVRAAIEMEVNKNGKDCVVGLLKYVGDVNGFFRGKIGRGRGRSLEVSNVGVYKPRALSDAGGGHGGWKSGKMVFSQCANVTGPAITASLITGADGRLTLGLCWLEGIVDGELMKKVRLDIERVMEWIIAQQG